MESADKVNNLWKSYKYSGDINKRNELIVHYSSLVKQVVGRMSASYAPYISVEDLISYGNFGLIDAIEKFDENRGIKFETYATIRIRGSIIDQIRKQDWIPRNLRQKSKIIEQEMMRLEERLGRSPTESELAKELNISKGQLNHVLEQLHYFMVVSLDQYIADTILVDNHLVDKCDNPQDMAELNDLRRVLSEAIDQLTEKEKTIVSLYYYEELTLKEIGLILNISESRVSQLHTRALMKLKNRLLRFKNELLYN